MTLDRAEVLRYLGYRGQALDERMNRLLDAAVSTCLAVARPKHALRVFDLVWGMDGIRLVGADLILPGKDIAECLRGAKKCALLAATLGVEPEARIRVLERTDLTASLMLDAAATECIEKYCDEAQEALRAELTGQSLFPGRRYSPGYGDLPLTLQPDILRVLDAGRRIGLTCTDHLILLPRKSVTAVIGLFDRPAAAAPRDCAGCALRETCAFRRRGEGGCMKG